MKLHKTLFPFPRWASFSAGIPGKASKDGSVAEETRIKEVGPEEAHRLIEDRDELQVLDVREPWEYERGHVPGAVLIPLGEVPERYHELDPERPVLCVCAGGVRSYKAAQVLVQSGFGDVTNMAEGTKGWIARGLPVE